MLTRPPRLPKSVTTARAAVLASLLSPGEFNNDHMFSAGTIGLTTVMRALVRRYRWPVVRQDFATGSGWACTWALSPEAIQFTLDIKVRNWLDEYRTSRAAVDQERVHVPIVDKHYRNFGSATKSLPHTSPGRSTERSATQIHGTLSIHPETEQGRQGGQKVEPS